MDNNTREATEPRTEVDATAQADAAPAPNAHDSAIAPTPPPPISLGDGSHYSSPIVAHVLRLPPGADLFPCLNSFLRQHNVAAACILSVVGSLTHVCLRFANVPDRDVVPLPPAHYEVLSLSGCLSSLSGSHLHMSVADRTGRCIGGHLQPTGNVVYTTMEIVVGIMPQLTFARETDDTYGYQELAVYPATAAAAANGTAAAAEAAFSSTSCCQPPAAQASTGSTPDASLLSLSDAAAAAVAAASPTSPKHRKKPEKRKHTEPQTDSSAVASPPAAVPAAKKKRASASLAAKRSTRNATKDDGDTVAAAAIDAVAPSASAPAPAPAPAPPAAVAASPVSSSPASWNAHQFSLFLTKLKMTHLLPIFERHKIDAARFLELNDQKLKKLKLKTPADEANVMACVNILRTLNAPAATNNNADK